VLENTVSGLMIAHFDYSDCDTCTSSHVTRPSCTINGVTTNVFPTVTYEAGSSEADAIYELADDAGGRFAIETGTNRLKTGATPLDHELANSPTGISSWTCTTAGNTYCFNAPGITNQVTSRTMNPGSKFMVQEEEILFVVLILFFFFLLYFSQARGMQQPRSGPSTSMSLMSLVVNKLAVLGKSLDRFLSQSELKM